MTDRHLRILPLIAHQRQRELRNYEAVDHGNEAVSTDPRQNLEQAAPRTSTRVADAQADDANLGQVERPDHDL
jgi:hypothetical protein